MQIPKAGPSHRLERPAGTTAPKDRHLREDGLLLGAKSTPGRITDCPHAAMARRHVAGGGGEQFIAAFQLGSNLGQAEGIGPTSRQFNRQWHATNACTNGCDLWMGCVIQCKGGLHRAGGRGKKGRPIGLGHHAIEW